MVGAEPEEGVCKVAASVCPVYTHWRSCFLQLLLDGADQSLRSRAGNLASGRVVAVPPGTERAPWLWPRAVRVALAALLDPRPSTLLAPLPTTGYALPRVRVQAGLARRPSFRVASAHRAWSITALGHAPPHALGVEGVATSLPSGRAFGRHVLDTDGACVSTSTVGVGKLGRRPTQSCRQG